MTAVYETHPGSSPALNLNRTSNASEKETKREDIEQCLLKKHIMNSQIEKQEGEGLSSTTLATTSESDDEYEEACTSSSDAIYGEKLEEKPDLMKSMLQHTYNQQANSTSSKGPEILNKFVGESELANRTLFTRARTCAPCILLFDEMDALTTKCGKEGGWVVERLLNQLLIELDGADQRKGLKSWTEPGRLLYVPLPIPDERELIVIVLGRKKPIDASVALMTMGRDDACKIVVLKTHGIDACWKLLGSVVWKLLVHKLVDKSHLVSSE
ncbi:Cell division control protein 48 -like protein C [Capsicum baccatum]|uniref:Cell division control protein 48-like protein C n=1 Tax=Capsicum baccatum TaxID=33114 RepID=A0A2G2VR57_CAPBA|nr:Cell division control protein 48 -like protein C [Capsicum baccatum]